LIYAPSRAAHWDEFAARRLGKLLCNCPPITYKGNSGGARDLRGGARASGIDLTEEALENVRQRIETYNLPAPEELNVADAENQPFPSDSFDLGYSFGVLHHTPDTERALRELVRVIRPGGELKVMLYNRHSIYILNRWVRFALLRDTHGARCGGFSPTKSKTPAPKDTHVPNW
jgi:SAM-dependent methyltransferase